LEKLNYYDKIEAFFKRPKPVVKGTEEKAGEAPKKKAGESSQGSTSTLSVRVN
jgi:hypothetical protein